MLGLHIITVDRTESQGALSINKLSDYNDEWCVTIDSGLITPAFIALAALAATYAAWSAPIVFGVMVATGYFLKSIFASIESEVSRIWNGWTHKHETQPCQDRKMAISLLTVAALYFMPSLVAAYAGLRSGSFVRHMVDSDPTADLPPTRPPL